MKWMKIETAPRNDVDILLSDGKSVTVGRMSFYRWENKLIAQIGGCECCGHDVEYDEFHPTHWMPLPEPPMKSEQ